MGKVDIGYFVSGEEVINGEVINLDKIAYNQLFLFDGYVYFLWLMIFVFFAILALEIIQVIYLRNRAAAIRKDREELRKIRNLERELNEIKNLIRSFQNVARQNSVNESKTKNKTHSAVAGNYTKPQTVQTVTTTNNPQGNNVDVSSKQDNYSKRSLNKDKAESKNCEFYGLDEEEKKLLKNAENAFKKDYSDGGYRMERLDIEDKNRSLLDTKVDYDSWINGNIKEVLGGEPQERLLLTKEGSPTEYLAKQVPDTGNLKDIYLVAPKKNAIANKDKASKTGILAFFSFSNGSLSDSSSERYELENAAIFKKEANGKYKCLHKGKLRINGR